MLKSQRNVTKNAVFAFIYNVRFIPYVLYSWLKRILYKDLKRLNMEGVETLEL